MRKLSTSYVAAFAATIITLFIVGACSQQPSRAPTIEPVVTPTSALGDEEDELSSKQVVEQASLKNSTQEDNQTTDTTDPTATATQEDNQMTETTDPTATATQEDDQTTDTTDPTATATQEDDQTTETTATATQLNIETIIDGILAELLDDATKSLRDLEEEVEADIALLADDDQALTGVGE
jgi:hypothetical protein